MDSHWQSHCYLGEDTLLWAFFLFIEDIITLRYCLGSIRIFIESANFLRKKTTWNKSTLNYEFIFCVNEVRGWMNFVWFQSEGGVRLQPWLLVSGEAGQTEMPAAYGAEPVPAAAAVCLRSSYAQSARSVQRHTEGNSSRAKVTGKSVGKWRLANRQHPSV